MWWVLLAISALLGLLLYLLLVPAPANVTGAPHPVISGMNVGGNGLARLGGQGWALAALQYVALAFIYLLIALGVNRERRTGVFWLLHGVGYLLSTAICWIMMSSYFSLLSGAAVPWWFGYPLPTAMMLMGVFTGGLYLCALYCWGFSRFIYTAEDEQAYADLLARHRSPGS